jgi:outer membrane protein assembly factor BamB
MVGSRTRLSISVAGAAMAVALAGCSEGPSIPKISDLNPFKEKQVPLAGKRIPVMQVQEKVPGELASADKPVVLPPARTNEAWSQPGGSANNAPGHLALASAVRQGWSADAGTGSSSSGRLTASPIVYDGRVFTLDAAGTVSAFSTGGGGAQWRVALVPEGEKAKEGSGGGLSADNGRIYAVSGFGVVAALDPKSGKKLWEKNLATPVRSAPTAAGDRVFVVTKEGRFYCLSGTDGAELWTVRGLPQVASRITATSPAVDGDIVVVPYPSGEIVALRVSDGTAVWTESLARTRETSQLNALSDAARPAIDNGTVFAVGHAGRMIATQQRTGERLWSLNVPGTQTPWVAGDNVFVVDTSGQLLAINRRDGKIVWTMQLPGASMWSGPTLAGDRLWLASSKGTLVAVEPKTGKVASQLEIGQPVHIAPVVAQGKMYILTDSARLISLN